MIFSGISLLASRNINTFKRSKGLGVFQIFKVYFRNLTVKIRFSYNKESLYNQELIEIELIEYH